MHWFHAPNHRLTPWCRLARCGWFGGCCEWALLAAFTAVMALHRGTGRSHAHAWRVAFPLEMAHDAAHDFLAFLTVWPVAVWRKVAVSQAFECKLFCLGSKVVTVELFKGRGDVFFADPFTPQLLG